MALYCALGAQWVDLEGCGDLEGQPVKYGGSERKFSTDSESVVSWPWSSVCVGSISAVSNPLAKTRKQKKIAFYFMGEGINTSYPWFK